MKKDFLSVRDLTRHEMVMLFKAARHLKGRPGQRMLKGKSLVLLFQKPSTRTRVSFEVGMAQLGGHAVYLDQQSSQLGRGETLADTARALSRYADGVVARVSSHSDLEELAREATIPVINGLSDLLHPCQAISDIFTITESFSHFRGLKLCYLGDGASNICHSLMLACHRLGIFMSVACPENYQPDKGIMAETADSVMVYNAPKSALKEADIVYTDVHVSMGKERQSAKRLRELRPYRLDTKKLGMAKPEAVVMHCLPAHRGQEITGEVMDGPRSLVWDQAENRLHVQKALLAMLL